MKRLFFMITICACKFAFASPAATQNWVSNYVDKAVSSYTAKSYSVSTNDITYDVYTSGDVVFTIEKPTVYAIMATNVTPAAILQGVTNRMFFVWNEPIHSYTNHAQIITATRTNLVWKGIQSDGNSFSNYFDTVGAMLQPSFAKEVTK